MRVVLDTYATADDGTLSKMIHPSGWTALTLELPWRDNKNGISCIPEGVYQVKWTRSPRLSIKYGRDYFTYEILGVEGRGGIRIHGGNLAGDVEKGMISHSLGCPLMGTMTGTMHKQKCVLSSKTALRHFETLMAQKPFELEVKRNGHW